MNSISFNPILNKITLYLRGDKVIEVLFTSLSPIWEENPSAYEGLFVDYLNGLIEERQDYRKWFRERGYKPSDSDFMIDPNLENLFHDPIAGEMVYMGHLVTAVTWNAKRREYLISIKQTRPITKI